MPALYHVWEPDIVNQVPPTAVDEDIARPIADVPEEVHEFLTLCVIEVLEYVLKVVPDEEAAVTFQVIYNPLALLRLGEASEAYPPQGSAHLMQEAA